MYIEVGHRTDLNFLLAGHHVSCIATFFSCVSKSKQKLEVASFYIGVLAVFFQTFVDFC